MTTVEVLDDPAQLVRLRAAWDRLWHEVPAAHPFLHWAWAATWWDHFGAVARPAVATRLRVLVVRDGDEVLAICPWCEVTTRPRGPMSVRTLVGLGQEDADLGGVLIGPGRSEVAALVAEVVADELRAQPTVLNLTRVRDDDPLLQAFQAVGGPGLVLQRESTDPFPVLDLPDEGSSEVVALLLKRNDVRRRWRRLGETGDLRFVPRQEGPVDVALDEFLRLHDLRWSVRDDEPNGIFATRRGRAFVREVSDRLDEARMLELSFVLHRGRPVAARYGLRRGSRYFGLKSGWDPRLARYGPGHMVLGKVVEHDAAEGVRSFELMRGSGSHKTSWATSVQPVGYWTVSAGGRTDAAVRTAFRAQRALRHRLRHR
ncbi:GNAT family N-acetyltransferase [Iamia majanohamensis]|uniref:GNAT family N-acetyltransferase n=1 Tax=Iamia majanohamensis TaxID=467976 RepID=A0AAF0BU91_9ACTN|nr:GNAT family N-acetyltransferase [Iamia majanohamensis]WCO65843.1 GNAT family N-acetyltransferase [Iamia majanohamensis]